jgi:anti-anti-sigma regulatory factor
VALVCVVTVWQGFVVAVAVGVLLSMLVFIARMNRSLVRSRYTAAARPSHRIYSRAVEAQLQPLRAQVLVLELEGALFFGSSDRLLADADAEAVEGRCRHLVLDLHRVGDVDETGVLALQQLQVQLQRRGATLRLAGVMPDSPRSRALSAFGCTAASWPDIDRAVEAAERQLLGVGADAALAPVALADCSLLQGIDGDDLARVHARLRTQRLRAGEMLFAEGSAADCLYVLTEGSVSVVSAPQAGVQQQRYLSLSPGMMFGETAMLDGSGRSAGVVADGDAVVHALTRADLDALGAAHPQLASRLYRNIALHLSQRLRSAAQAWHASTR